MPQWERSTGFSYLCLCWTKGARSRKDTSVCELTVDNGARRIADSITLHFHLVVRSQFLFASDPNFSSIHPEAAVTQYVSILAYPPGHSIASCTIKIVSGVDSVISTSRCTSPLKSLSNHTRPIRPGSFVSIKYCLYLATRGSLQSHEAGHAGQRPAGQILSAPSPATTSSGNSILRYSLYLYLLRLISMQSAQMQM